MQIAAREFVEAMTLPVWQAMAAVLWLEGRVANLPKLGEPTDAKAALTDGDCVSQEILVTALRAHFPFVRLDAEEDTPGARAFAGNASEYTALVDPIDGTLRYLRGDGVYAVIVGLERCGRVEAALVALPQEGVVIRAERNGGTEIAHGGFGFARAALETGGTRFLVSDGVPEHVRERLRDRGLALEVAAGGAIGVAPLLAGTLGALRISREARGLSQRAWVAALPTLEAGGAVETLDGPFPERYCEGVSGMIVASNADGIAKLRADLA